MRIIFPPSCMSNMRETLSGQIIAVRLFLKRNLIRGTCLLPYMTRMLFNEMNIIYMWSVSTRAALYGQKYADTTMTPRRRCKYCKSCFSWLHVTTEAAVPYKPSATWTRDFSDSTTFKLKFFCCLCKVGTI